MTPPPNAFVSMIPLIAIFLIFYFLLIRPQQKQADEHKKMLAALKKGDRVLTSAGFYGTVVMVKGEDLEVRFADNVKLLMARSAVSKLLPDSQPALMAKTPTGGGA